MSAVELLTELAQQDVRLWVEDGRLRYRAPRGVLTGDRLERLARYKSELMPLLSRCAKESGALHSLSHGQRALWFLNKLSPGSASYNVSFAARVRSEIDIGALRRTFDTLVSRHATLRTSYVEVAGEPFQQIHDDIRPSFELVDASGWRWEELRERAAAAYEQHFDLESGRVIRLHLFKRTADDHLLLLVAHHIAIDAWSLGLVLDEFRLLYAAQRSGRTAPDLPPETDYVSYVLAEAASLTSPAGERLRAFWEEQLAGEFAALNMPTDRARPSTPTTQGDSCAFVLTRELSDLIRSLARAEETTAYTFLLASLLVLLRRMTGQDDVIITSPTSGRTRPEYAQTVGLFVNRVVIRAKVSGTQTFREFLAQVRRTILLALEHQDYPFPLLFQRLQRDRQPSPLSQVSFNFLKAQRGDQLYSLFVAGGEASRMNVGGLELEPFELAQQEGQLDLSLLVLETEGVFHGSFKFSLDLFDRPTVAQISKQYLTLLESIVADPDNTIARLPIMSVDDRQQMVLAWRTIAEAS